MSEYHRRISKVGAAVAGTYGSPSNDDGRGWLLIIAENNLDSLSRSEPMRECGQSLTLI
jgi:hypothetical protein